MKQRIYKMLWGILLAGANLCAGCQHAPTQTVTVSRSSETMALLHHLKQQAERGYMFGQHDATLYGIGWKGDEGRSDVKSVCGDYPAVISFDLGHLELGDSVSLDSVSFDAIRRAAVSHYLRGGVVSMSWHADNPLTGGSAWDVTDSTAVASILPGGRNADKFQTWLGRLTAFLNSLQTPDGQKVPVIFRPWHEHTGSWFWWGQALCTTEQYKELWHLTADRLAADGVDNVLLAYSPGGDAEDYWERYPGDGLIDVLGFDTYQYGGEEGQPAFIGLLQRNLERLDIYCREHDKVYAVTETGYVCIPRSDWWTQVLATAVGDYRPAYVLVWRNACDQGLDHYFAPYPGQVSEQDFIGFYQLPQTLFLQDLDKMYSL